MKNSSILSDRCHSWKNCCTLPSKTKHNLLNHHLWLPGSTDHPLDSWRRALNATIEATRNTDLWEITQKCLLRWYLTPCCIGNFSPYQSSACWRNCGAPGTQYHILWPCPHLSTYCPSVFDLIQQVVQLTILMTLGMALFFLEIDMVPSAIRTLVSYFLLAARLTFTRHWKDSSTPGLSEVIWTTHVHSNYEQLFVSSNGKHHLDVALSTYKLWLEWCNAYYLSASVLLNAGPMRSKGKLTYFLVVHWFLTVFLMF